MSFSVRFIILTVLIYYNIASKKFENFLPTFSDPYDDSKRLGINHEDIFSCTLANDILYCTG